MSARFSNVTPFALRPLSDTLTSDVHLNAHKTAGVCVTAGKGDLHGSFEHVITEDEVNELLRGHVKLALGIL